jgi:uncharacterized membrane protein YgcG
MQPHGVTTRLATRFWLIALSLCLSAPFATAKDWRITDFNDKIAIEANGSTSVQERITLEFHGQWQGIHRTIPIDYPGPNGTNYTLFLEVRSVTDGSGNKLKYASSTAHGFRDLKIFLPDAVDATRTVEIDYTVRDAIRYFDEHDEFYWNVTWNDWPVPIDHASATVSLPSSSAGSLRAQAFTGVYGSAEQGAIAQVNGSEVAFETNSPLPMRGGMTIDIFIPKGIVTQPGALTRWLWFLGSNPVVFVPFLTLAVMFTLWWYKGRDPDPGISVAPMYAPPPGMTPAETGTLLEDKIHPRDITATIVDLAVRGYLKIEEVSETTLGIFHHKDYLFHLLKARGQWQGLVPHEQVMLENIFGQEDQTRLSALKNRFYVALPAVKQDIMAALKNKSMYSVDPDSANSYSIGAAAIIAALLIGLQVTGAKDLLSSIPLAIVCGIISAIIWWLFAREMTAKTAKGVQTRIAVLGFQEFMNRVDADRLKRMPPDTFEKYLAYAMALGVEHHWAQAFAGLITSAPSWYVASGGYPPGLGFNPILFSSSMHSMATDMSQVFVSAPRASSSGSGFDGGGGGGGFSGGGFGGGGGSAF